MDRASATAGMRRSKVENNAKAAPSASTTNSEKRPTAEIVSPGVNLWQQSCCLLD